MRSSGNPAFNRAFSLTWPVSMQIYWNKRKCLHKKRVQLPQDWFRHQYGRRDVMWKHSIDSKLRLAGLVRYVRRFSLKVVIALIWECGWECKRDSSPSHIKVKAQTAWAYPGFISMKYLGVLLLPPGLDAAPSQGYYPAVCRRYPFIHLSEERQSKVKFLV